MQYCKISMLNVKTLLYRRVAEFISKVKEVFQSTKNTDAVNFKGFFYWLLHRYAGHHYFGETDNQSRRMY
jgi:hypothetical protein